MKYTIATVLTLGFLSAPLALGAERMNIYIHGFTVNEQSCNDQTSCSKVWKEQHSNYPARHVAYNGWKDPLVWKSDRGAYKLVGILNKYCAKTGPNSCRLFCHSMGCLTSGYVMANYGKNYRMVGVTAIASAQGGSEYASAGPAVAAFLISPLGAALVEAWMDGVTRLRVSVARNSGYSHDDTDGVPFQHSVGNKDLFWPINLILPGKDDSVVAYHSTCAMADVEGFDSCGGHNKSYWSTCKKWGWLPYPCQKSRYYRQLNGHSTYRTFGQSHIPIADKTVYQVPN